MILFYSPKYLIYVFCVIFFEIKFEKACFVFRDNKDSPPLISSPAITHSSEMDLIQFVELFRSFMVRSRKDIHTLFEQIAASPKRLSETNCPESSENDVSTLHEKTPTSYLGRVSFKI